MHEPDNYSCPFCRILNSDKQKQDEVLIETEHAVAFFGLSGNQASGPTVLIASKAHYESLYDLPDEVISDAFQLARRVALLLKEQFNVDGTTIWQHNEPAGNQEVWHFHLHVKGRFDGDSLYAKTAYRLTDEQHGKLIGRFRKGL